MAITVANAAKGAGTTSVSSLASQSLAPAASTIYILHATAYRAAGTPNIPTCTGSGLTWTQLATDTNGSTPVRTTVFYALATGAETPGASTTDYGGQTQDAVQITILTVTGSKQSGTNGVDAFVQAPHANGNSGTAAVTLAAFADAVNNVCLFMVAIPTSGAITVGSGFTQITSGAVSTLLRSQQEQKLGEDLLADATFTSISWAAVACEIAIASSGGGRLAGPSVLAGGNPLTVGVLTNG